MPKPLSFTIRSDTRLILNSVIGDRGLCAWQPVPGITWVQTRVPNHAKRLAKRRDARLVVVGVAGGYLRTFEFRHTLAWARKLIERYVRSAASANEAKKGVVAARGARTAMS